MSGHYWDLVLCKGSDVRPGVLWSPPLCWWLLRGKRSIWCFASDRMYVLASFGLRRSASGFCVAGAALGALQGVGCTPWRPLVSAALPVAFAWQARHLVLCKGSDVRPGVPWSPVAFAWQARHLVLCKGSDVRPGVPWSPPLCGGFCVAGAALGALKGSDVRPGVPWSPVALRGRCGTWCSARGRMYALASLGLRCSAGGFCVAGAVHGALTTRGRMYALAPLVSAALPVAFAWQVRHLVRCKGSDVRPGVPWSPESPVIDTVGR